MTIQFVWLGLITSSQTVPVLLSTVNDATVCWDIKHVIYQAEVRHLSCINFVDNYVI